MNKTVIMSRPFGHCDGRTVNVWSIERLTRRGKVKLEIMEYGATLVSAVLQDGHGNEIDIALGHDSLEQYRNGGTYFGAIAGRYGNRIRNSKAYIRGELVALQPNENVNHLHGGTRGFDKAIWDAFEDEQRDELTFSLISPDGDMGYPGKLDINVTFKIDDEGGFSVLMQATTNKETLCNPVHHTYWNLGGQNSGTILDHNLSFNSEFYTPIDSELLATGEILSVKKTPFDFTKPKAIGKDIEALGGGRATYVGGGYDHNFVLRSPGEDGLRLAATIESPTSKLGMRLLTTEPGVQFYTAGYLTEAHIGKGGHAYQKYAGFTLETQKFPCSPEFAHFESAILQPGKTYRHLMQFQFFNATNE